MSEKSSSERRNAIDPLLLTALKSYLFERIETAVAKLHSYETFVLQAQPLHA